MVDQAFFPRVVEESNAEHTHMVRSCISGFSLWGGHSSLMLAAHLTIQFSLPKEIHTDHQKWLLIECLGALIIFG